MSEDEIDALHESRTTLLEAELAAAQARIAELERERNGLLEITNAVLHISDMSDAQLRELVANCRAAIDKAREER